MMNLSFIIFSLIIIRKMEDLSLRILNNFTTGTHMEKLSNHMENGSATIVQWVCLVEKTRTEGKVGKLELRQIRRPSILVYLIINSCMMCVCVCVCVNR